jgi:NADPH2:quinone reductase
MRSLQVADLGGPDSLRLVEAPAPADAGQVLIEVHAAGVSFPDLLMTRGQYQLRPELPFAPGTEVAGVVGEAPAGGRWRTGERVAAYTPWGGYSELAAVPETAIVALPDEVDYVEGAALMNNYQTAYFALRVRTDLRPGQALVVHGAAGGVGIAAVQVALALGARPIAVVRGVEKAAFVAGAGCADVIDLERVDNWVEEVRELTGGGAEMVFDPVGGERFAQSLRALAPDGKALVIGFAGGEIEQIPSNHLLLKNVDAVGVAWGMRLVQEPELLGRIGTELAALVAERDLRPLIGATFPLAEGADALRQMSERAVLGKSVLRVR